jgi:zinc/manganese transport system substrate-binding protein
MQRFAIIVVLFLVTAHSAAEARLHVVTSFLPLYCWTANVADDLAIVENLLPPRSEPHEYAFTPGDARKLSSADLIVVNGLGLEPWLSKLFHGSPTARQRILMTSSGLSSQLIAGEREGDPHRERNHPNAHVWLDPQLAMIGASNIAAALQQIDSTHATTYATNAQRYLTRLRRLDHDIQQSLAGVTNRAIVTYHDAFPYFARRYGLEIAGVVEQVPDVNPTPKYLSRLARTMRERNIHVIFIPPNSTTRLARRIAEDLHVELVELDTLETGAPSPSAYEEHMRANAAALQKYLK